MCGCCFAKYWMVIELRATMTSRVKQFIFKMLLRNKEKARPNVGTSKQRSTTDHQPI